MKPINPLIIDNIELGNYANDGTGDDLRTAFIRVNNNFALLNSEITISDGRNVGTGGLGLPGPGEEGLFKQKNGLVLEFKALSSTDDTVSITSNASTVDLSVITNLSNDPSPSLGADLDLNHKNVFGGNVSASSWGLDPVSIYSLLSILITSNPLLSFDLGGAIFAAGSIDEGGQGYPIDMNTGVADGFALAVASNSYDFGSF